MMSNNKSPLPIDAQQREQALALGQSFCVTAPAGSGKTELLTRRVLKLLAHCNEPEEILCITFTRKAAAEMKTRIMDTLAKGKESTEPHSDHDKQQWLLARSAFKRNQEKNWQLLENPNRLRIQTIDSFCHSLTRQLPLLSKMGASVNVCEKPESYYLEASRNLLSSIESNDACSQALATVLDHMDNDVEKVEQLFVTMLSKRDQWLPHIEHTAQTTHTENHTDPIRAQLESWLQEVIEEQLQTAYKLLQNHEDEIISLANYAGKNLAKSQPEHPLANCTELTFLPETHFNALGQWLAISELLLTRDNKFRKTVNKTIGFNSDGKGEEKELQKQKKQQHKALIAVLSEFDTVASELALIRTLPSPYYSDQQWQILAALTSSLKYLAAHLKVVFQQHGEVDYSEVMAAALMALGDESQPTDLALLLDQKINHILIDEFQDTSILQSRLVEQLIAGWSHEEHRTLFVVGDGMQSIYKFRNANVGLFLKARHAGIGHLALTPLNLTVNFRSQQTVIDWVNHHFSRAFPQQENISLGAIGYSPSDTYKFDTPPLETLVDKPADSSVKSFAFTGDNSKLQEAYQVLNLVEAALHNNPQNSIGILVRNRNHLDTILPVLRQANIRWQANELDSLATNQLIQDLLTLTRALYHLSDRTAWLALLRTPFCGLNLADLHALATFNPDSAATTLWQAILNCEQIESLSPDGLRRLSRIRTSLKTSLAEKFRKPVRAWIEGSWCALGGPVVAHQNELNDVNAFFQLLEKSENAGQVDINLLAESIDKLYAQADPEAPATIQVMTIHKSKGLEFDSVIIPGLDRTPRSDDTPILRWHERINKHGQDQLLLAPIAGPGNNANSIFDYIKYEDKRKTDLEITRLLYVACTRAKSNLYLTACLKETEQGDIKPPAASSLLASIWPELEAHCIVNAQNEKTRNNSSKLNANKLADIAAHNQQRKIISNWALPQFDQEHLLKAYRGQEYPQDQENRPEYNLRTLDKHIGTVSHEALYTISKASPEQRTQGWQPHTLEQYLPLWQTRLKQLGMDENAAELGSQKVKALMTSALQCKTGQWLLNANHQNAESELPITVYEQNQIREYVIDRTFVDENNVRWIIDYKTSSPITAGNIEDFLAIETEKYQQQLKRYKSTFEQLEKRTVKTALYFPALQLQHEID